MTEFKKAAAAVEALEALVADLVADLVAGAAAAAAPPAAAFAKGLGLIFDPPARREPSADGHDWEVVGLMSAFECQVSLEQRSKFAEAAARFEELAPTAARMRKRCCARAELEVIQAQLRELLPGSPDNEVVEVESFVKAEGGRAGGGRADDDAADDVAPLRARACELGRAATYGARMAEQAADLVARLDAARALYDTDVVPRLAGAVAAAAADEAEQLRLVEFAAQDAEEAEKRRAQDDAQRVVLQLLAASEEGLQKAQRVAAEEQSRHLAAATAEAEAVAAARRPGVAAPCARAFS